jgi:hypothetical protein
MVSRPRVVTIILFGLLLIPTTSAAAETTGLDATDAGTVTVTIDFDGLPGVQGSPFTRYKEFGFRVAAPASSEWQAGQNYGNPAPYIYFVSPAGTETSGAIRVTMRGRSFRFTSIDLYSSVTGFPYGFRGIRDGAVVFTAEGAIPNPMGGFITTSNPYSTVPIDALEVVLHDPAPPAGPNPVGLDNIRLTITAG